MSIDNENILTDIRGRLLIIDNVSPFLLPLIRSFSGIRELKTDILLISDKKARHIEASKHRGKIEYIDHLDDSNIVEVVSGLAKKLGSCLVIPTREHISSLLYKYQNELEKHCPIHPLPCQSILDITSNKWNLNTWLRDNGFPSSLASSTSSGWTGSYPLLLKPVQGIGGQGIKLLRTETELEEIRKNPEVDDVRFFLQEYLPGEDIDISFFAINGEILYYTIQKGLMPETLVYSKGIVFVRDEKLLRLTREIVAKLNYNGIAHLDFRYSREKYFLIDFNARYWSSVQGSRAMGVNFPLLATSYVQTNKTIPCTYRTGAYYFTSTAIRSIWSRIWNRKLPPVKIRDTQLRYFISDPWPEILQAIKNLNNSIRTFLRR